MSSVFEEKKANAPTDAALGSIGYLFRKHFPEHGFFEGIVVQIRLGAADGKDRRCLYSDGDEEDLSISELEALPRSYVTKKSNEDGKTKKRKQNSNKTPCRTLKKSKGDPADELEKVGMKAKKAMKISPIPVKMQNRQKTSNLKLSKSIFSSVGELVPIDKAAEATLEQPEINSEEKINNQQSKVSEGGDENDSAQEADTWLEKMALLLGAGARSKLQPAKLKKNPPLAGKSQRPASVPISPKRVSCQASESSATLSTAMPNDSNSTCSSSSNRSNAQTSSTTSLCPMSSVDISHTASESSSISGDAFIALSDILPGNRHGSKVFHIKDRKRRIGEIILEHPGGWAEAIIKGAIKKSRVGMFVVVPDHYNIGDMANTTVSLSDQDGKPNSTTTSKSKHLSQNAKAGATTKKVNVPSEPSSISQSQPCPKQSKQGDQPSQKGSSSSGKSSIARSSNFPTTEPILTMENLFYWWCDRCTMVNSYLRVTCDACSFRKRNKTSRSALLQIAEGVVEQKVTCAKEALGSVPLVHQSAIPEIVIRKLVASKWPKAVQPKDPPPKPSQDIESYFYWVCGACTMKNSFKKSKCDACNHRRKHATSSALLDIAEKAARDARTTDEGMEFIPINHRQAIPESVMASLITCIFMIGKKSSDQRRCLRPKAPGVDYCVIHCDPLLLTSSGTKDMPREDNSPDYQNSVLSTGVNSSNTSLLPHQYNHLSKRHSSKSSVNTEKGIFSVILGLPKFLSKSLDTFHDNILNWRVNCIEDAILCQENDPFPLGLLVRRFFPRYGFHDGRIIKLQRRQIFDSEKGVDRPVLIYRVLYNDGDEEDFMHHEINSLRQMYDRCNVDSLAAPLLQIPPGTLYETHQNGIVKIVRHSTAPGAATRGEGGFVHMKFCQIGHPWTDLVLDLTKLQLSIVRKLKLGESFVIGPNGEKSCVKEEVSGGCFNIPEKSSEAISPAAPAPQISLEIVANKRQSCAVTSPVLEWSSSQKLQSSGDNISDKRTGERSRDENEKEFVVSPNLSLLRKESHEENVERTDDHSPFSAFNKINHSCIIDDETCIRNCSSQAEGGWDPANALNFISWDPYGTTTCEICQLDKDDHQILICDECHCGFHMYCVRPVIVNVPKREWLCSQCSTDRDGGESFESFRETVRNDPSSLSKFLCLPFDNPDKFTIDHKYELDLFSPSTHVMKRQAVIGTNRSIATVKVGSLFFSKNVNKNDWALPLPLSSSSQYVSSLVSMVAAMKYCGMKSYSGSLVYTAECGVTEKMNDASLNKTRIEPLSQRNLGIFNHFLENQKRGGFPPIQVVHDEKIGFSVEALASIPRHTLIAEYVGEITTIERSGETSSDSLMMLLDTGDPKTSLIIDPTRTGNIARFLSGINNRSHASRRKANVRTRRFALDGKCRVALFTSKKIDAGDKLNYDYNAGVEGKTVEEWANTGFYDTSNFF